MEHDTSKRQWVLVSVLLGSFTILLNNNSLNVALPHFMDHFGIKAFEAQWLLLSFMLSMALTMTLTGFITDKLGEKITYILGMGSFVLGSFLGVIVDHFHLLVIFRIFQGFGAGVVMPVGISILYAYFPKNKRGFIVGLLGISNMVAPAISPTLSGIIIQYTSWHVLFLINIPIGLFSIAAALLFVKNNKIKKQITFDYKGFILVAISIICIILGINSFSWSFVSNWTSYMIIIFGLVSLFWFIKHELSCEQPLMNLRIFKYRVYAVCTIISSIAKVSMFMIVLLIPILMQDVLDYSEVTTGYTLFPQAMAMGIAMVIGGKIVDQYGSRILLPVGMLIIVMMSFLLSFLLGHTSVIALSLLLLFRGLGVGFIHSPTTATGLSVLPEKEVSRAMSLNNIIGQISLSIAVVVFTSYYEHGKEKYMLLENAEEAGIHAIQDIFASIGIIVLIFIPVIWWALRYLDKDGPQTV